MCFDVKCSSFSSLLCVCVNVLTGEREKLCIHTCSFFFLLKITTRRILWYFHCFFPLLFICVVRLCLFFFSSRFVFKSLFFFISHFFFLFVYARMIRSRWYRNTKKKQHLSQLKKKRKMIHSHSSCFHSLDRRNFLFNLNTGLMNVYVIIRKKIKIKYVFQVTDWWMFYFIVVFGVHFDVRHE